MRSSPDIRAVSRWFSGASLGVRFRNIDGRTQQESIEGGLEYSDLSPLTKMDAQRQSQTG
jgi:hypothetical protein